MDSSKEENAVRIVDDNKEITQIITINDKGKIISIIELKTGRIYVAKNYERKSVLDNVKSFSINNVKLELDIENILDIEDHPDIKTLEKEAVDSLKKSSEKKESFVKKLKQERKTNDTTNLDKTRR